jgi:hypothetical protein
MMEEYETGTENEESSNGLKSWLQDNLRIIVSIVIVAVIAGGIYSYSKRGETPIATEDTESAITEEESIEIASEPKQEEVEQEGVTVSETKEDSSQVKKEDEKIEPKTESPKTEAVTSTQTSKETGSSFVETAAKGEGTTHLARRALADYLEKNPDSSLSKEHKIYIEDYLRKNISRKSYVSVGTEVEFSKELIQQSIEQSKKLTENQLKNLQKYSAQVSSLS